MPDIAYDAAYPDIAAELAKHPLMICAYTDGPHAYSKAQVDQIRAGGAAVIANHERGAGDLLGGALAGKTAALAAVAGVLSWGMPADGSIVIVYSVDVNAPASSFPAIGAAFDAINIVHAGRFLADCYGEGALIDYLVQTGRIAQGVVAWLSASKGYPGYNAADPNVGAVQQVGSDVPGTDLNIITNAAGLHPWWPDSHLKGEPMLELLGVTDAPHAGQVWVWDGVSAIWYDGPGEYAEDNGSLLVINPGKPRAINSADLGIMQARVAANNTAANAAAIDPNVLAAALAPLVAKAIAGLLPAPLTITQVASGLQLVPAATKGATK